MANNLRVFNTNSEYQSAELVYPAVSYIEENDTVMYDATAPAPHFTGKYQVTYTGGTSYSAECDSSVTLNGETIPSANQVETLIVGDCVVSGVTNFNADYGYGKLKTVEFGTGLEKISSYAFLYDSKLDSVTINSTKVSLIANSVFNGCSNLESFTIYTETPPMLFDDIFADTKIASGTGHIYVPASAVDAYKADSKWGLHSNVIEAIQ